MLKRTITALLAMLMIISCLPIVSLASGHYVKGSVTSMNPNNPSTVELKKGGNKIADIFKKGFPKLKKWYKMERRKESSSEEGRKRPGRKGRSHEAEEKRHTGQSRHFGTGRIRLHRHRVGSDPGGGGAACAGRTAGCGQCGSGEEC